MNWETPQTQSVWVSLPFVLRRQTAQLLGVRASSGRPGYTRGRATIEIAVFGVLCATAYSPRSGAFMLGGDAHLNHEKVIQKSRVFGPESLDHERGIHGSLQTDPDGFGAGFAIALAAQETTE
jgi:hypothetical protein